MSDGDDNKGWPRWLSILVKIVFIGAILALLVFGTCVLIFIR